MTSKFEATATITEIKEGTGEEIETVDADVQEILTAITTFINGGGTHGEFSSPAAKEVYDDFLLGLTFPASIQVGERGSKRRVLLTALSSIWHGVHLHVLQQIANNANIEEEEDEE